MPDEDKPPDSGQEQVNMMFLAEDHSLVAGWMADTVHTITTTTTSEL